MSSAKTTPQDRRGDPTELMWQGRVSDQELAQACVSGLVGSTGSRWVFFKDSFQRVTTIARYRVFRRR